MKCLLERFVRIVKHLSIFAVSKHCRTVSCNPQSLTKVETAAHLPDFIKTWRSTRFQPVTILFPSEQTCCFASASVGHCFEEMCIISNAWVEVTCQA